MLGQGILHRLFSPPILVVMMVLRLSLTPSSTTHLLFTEYTPIIMHSFFSSDGAIVVDVSVVLRLLSIYFYSSYSFIYVLVLFDNILFVLFVLVFLLTLCVQVLLSWWLLAVTILRNVSSPPLHFPDPWDWMVEIYCRRHSWFCQISDEVTV